MKNNLSKFLFLPFLPSALSYPLARHFTAGAFYIPESHVNNIYHSIEFTFLIINAPLFVVKNRIGAFFLNVFLIDDIRPKIILGRD